MYNSVYTILFQSCFAVAILVIVIVTTVLVYDNMKKRCGETYIEVCKNETCQDLNDLMKNLMKKRLEFDDDEKEKKTVIAHLTKMKNEVHRSGE